MSAKTTLWQDLLATAGNKPFMILLMAYTISAIGNNLPATLILYYVQYVLQSRYAEAYLLLYSGISSSLPAGGGGWKMWRSLPAT